MNYWFTADTHFFHINIIKYCNRPFKSVEEMNEIIIKQWNECVKEEDIIYHLGDFGWKDCTNIIKRLNGQKFLICGSHDSEAMRLKKYWCQIIPLKVIRLYGNWIVLTHCAMRVWEKSHFNSWNLYGHSHGILEPLGKAWDVGVDTHNFYPYSYEEIVGIMNKRPDNLNYIRRKNG